MPGPDSVGYFFSDLYLADLFIKQVEIRRWFFAARSVRDCRNRSTEKGVGKMYPSGKAVRKR